MLPPLDDKRSCPPRKPAVTISRARTTRGGGMKRRDFLRYGAIGMVAAAAPALTRRAAQSGEIVACAIHPAFGIARVGNSPNELFLGPEVPGPHPLPAGGFKD